MRNCDSTALILRGRFAIVNSTVVSLLIIQTVRSGIVQKGRPHYVHVYTDQVE